MGSEVLDAWLVRYDPVHRGWTRAGIANGLCATSGFFFPRIRGGHNLYRSIVGDPALQPELVGTADAGESEVRTFSWVTHQPGRTYLYRLVPVSGGGVENWNDAARTVVGFSEAGHWTGSLPHAPTDVQLVPLAQGRFALRWSYYPQDEHAEPAGFALYTDHGEGSGIDYGLSEAKVIYRPGRVHYEYITRSWAHGTGVVWAVRSCSRSGYEEQNTNQAFAVARAEGPPANPVVQVAIV